MLRESLRIVETTRQCLLLRDGEGLQQSVEQQVHTATAAESLRERRNHLRNEIAELLGLDPRDATVSELADHAPSPFDIELRELRSRMGRLAIRIGTLHRANAVLALQTNHIVAGALQKLLGNQLSRTSYAKTGLHQNSNSPSLIDTDT